MPEGVGGGHRAGHVSGCAALRAWTAKLRVQLMGSRHHSCARSKPRLQMLEEATTSVAADVWSMTSVNELQRDGKAAQRWNMLHPGGEKPRVPIITAAIVRCSRGRLSRRPITSRRIPTRSGNSFPGRFKVTLGHRWLRSFRHAPASCGSSSRSAANSWCWRRSEGIGGGGQAIEVSKLVTAAIQDAGHLRG